LILNKKIADDLAPTNALVSRPCPAKQLAAWIEEIGANAMNKVFHIPSNKEDEGRGLCAVL